MIYITGDTHGDIDFEKLAALREYGVNSSDFLIICGDAGICWNENILQYFLKLYNSIGCTVIFVDGNHENFDMLNNMPLVEYCSALMHRIDKRIFHVLRGEIMTLEGKTFLCLGGAHSIDKAYRTIHVSWWPEEDINNHDIDNAIYNLAKYNNKVDYVITHCCDTPTVQKAFNFKRDKSTDCLNFIDKVVDYQHWFFGHYHFDRQVSNKKTCLYKAIICLDSK